MSVHDARVTLIHFFVSVNNPKLGKPCVRAACKKTVHEERAKLPGWSADPFTSLHGCRLPSLEPRLKWELPGGVQCSRLPSFEGMCKCKWLGVNVNEAMIRNLSFTVESITQSAAKEIAAQENSLDSLAKVLFDNRIALDHFYLFIYY